MNEIEKLYENCGIKKVKNGYCSWDCACPYDDIECGDDCPYWKYDEREYYPQFTAEKQLELIKWLIQKKISDERIINSNFEKTYFYCSYLDDYYESEPFVRFEEALANVFNYYWQDLTSEEKEQVRGILE